jgi:putative sterol carrier protein
VKKVKLDNKTLLKLLAEASGTSWPAGARLEYDLQSRQVVVADKTGTNILFICDDRTSHTNVYLTLSWDDDAGPLSGKVVQSNPDMGDLTADWQARFDIYFDSVGDWQFPTEFHADGLSVEKYSNKVTGAGNIVNIQENFTPFSRGQLNGQSAVLTGKITAKGKTTDPLNQRPY